MGDLLTCPCCHLTAAVHPQCQESDPGLGLLVSNHAGNSLPFSFCTWVSLAVNHVVTAPPLALSDVNARIRVRCIILSSRQVARSCAG